MSPRIFLTTLAAVVAGALPMVSGTSSLRWSGQAQAAPVAASLVRADPQLLRVQAALQAAERGDFDAAQYADLARHPLYAWIEYANLRRDVDAVGPERARAFLARYDGLAGADESVPQPATP